MQRAGSDTILACSNDDVALTICLEDVRVAEIVAQACRTAVDDDALFLPLGESLVSGYGLHDGGAGVVDSGVEGGRSAAVVIDTAAPATFYVVGLARCNGNRLLAPVIEVGAGEMPPVQASHIRAVGVLLEEDVVAAVGIEHAVALVHPAARGHSMELRAPERGFVAPCGIVERGGRSRGRALGHSCGVVDCNVVNDSAECVDEERTPFEVGGRLAYHEACRARGHARAAHACRAYLGAVEEERSLVAGLVHHGREAAPAPAGQFLRGGHAHEEAGGRAEAEAQVAL